jgi:hypothetical protein
MVGRLAALLAALVLAGTAGAASPGSSPAEMKRIVREWSRLLNAADNEGLAKLFRLPAIVEQGGVGYRLKTAKHIAIWHDGLPCSGRVTSITIRGRVATAVFLLGDRPSTGSRCDATGELAAAAFEIVGGKIVHWTQVAVPAAAKSPPSGPSA